MSIKAVFFFLLLFCYNSYASDINTEPEDRISAARGKSQNSNKNLPNKNLHDKKNNKTSPDDNAVVDFEIDPALEEYMHEKKNISFEQKNIYEKEEQNKLQEKFINNLIEIDYNVQQPPEKLYNRPFSQENSHLPTIYFKSHYAQMAFDAASHGDVNMVRLFIDKYNFHKKETQFGDTMLHFAAKNNNINALRLLVSRGANVDAVNNHGITSLHFAASNNFKEAVRILLSFGANSAIKDIYGKTAGEYAIDNDYLDICQMINEYAYARIKQ